MLPAYARAWLGAGERVLAFASTADAIVVATPRGLWMADHRPPAHDLELAPDSDPGGQSGDLAGRLLAWESIVTARWSADVLTVIPAAQVRPQILHRLPAVSFALPDSGDLPRVVRQRVDRSVAHSQRRALPTGSTVLLVARRVSGRDGLVWYAVFDADLDVENPQACRQALILLESVAARSAPSGAL